MISQRAQVLFQETPPLVTAHFKCAQDPYDKENNPKGYINFGTAENFLIEDKLISKINEVPSLSAKDLHYNYPCGSIELRKNYSEFLKKFLAIDKFDENHIAVGCGLSAILEILSFVIFNEGDEVLTVSPLYNGFYHDFETRFRAKIRLSYALDDKGSFSIEALREDLQRTKVKVLLINNPHNPVGYTYTALEIREIISLAKELDVKIIADEVYAKSVFGKQEFTSFLDNQYDDLDYQDSIFHLYGLAKDFALSGFKVGFFASTNAKVTQAVQSLAYFHTVSTQTQHTCSYLLSELEWCQSLFKENSSILAETYNELISGLAKIGLEHFPSDSGIFTMVNLSKYLKDNSKEGELELFNFLIDELKISITPGQFFGYEKYGYFRVCYAKPNYILKEFLLRLSNIREF